MRRTRGLCTNARMSLAQCFRISVRIIMTITRNVGQLLVSYFRPFFPVEGRREGVKNKLDGRSLLGIYTWMWYAYYCSSKYIQGKAGKITNNEVFTQRPHRCIETIICIPTPLCSRSIISGNNDEVYCLYHVRCWKNIAVFQPVRERPRRVTTTTTTTTTTTKKMYKKFQSCNENSNSGLRKGGEGAESRVLLSYSAVRTYTIHYVHTTQRARVHK